MNKMKCILISLLIAFSATKDFSSPSYQAKSASEKMATLWESIEATKGTSASWPSAFAIALIFLENLNISFDEKGDVMPWLRRKLIHSVGVIARSTWTTAPAAKRYSGILAGGCDNLLLRLSVAKNPDPSKSSADEAIKNFVPGMAFKCLRSGRPSANLIAMYSVAGQASWNFFKNDFTHAPAYPDDRSQDGAGKALVSKFSGVNKWPMTIGLEDLAHFDQQGRDESRHEGELTYPFQLIFRPRQSHTARFIDNYEDHYVSQLTGLPAGPIYDVYAIDKPGCEEVIIGTISNSEQFIKSKWADESLFFRHNSPTIDFKSYPEWAKYRDELSFGIFTGLTVKRSAPVPKTATGCPFKTLFG